MVFVDVGISLDGFIAGPNANPGNPLGDGGVRIHEWALALATFHERLGFGGGQTGPDDDRVRHVFDRTGAYIMGRRMFDEGEVSWPERAPFQAPVFVLTHHERGPWVRPGGTTFHFVTDGIESALNQARDAAGAKDIRISGGADCIRQYLEAGAVDELNLHVAPILLGRGLRLFDSLDPSSVTLVPEAAEGSSRVTHLRYRVAR